MEPRNNGEKTARAMPEGRRFQPGNPGRPKGSRHKLGEAFVSALQADFQEHGDEVIKKVREEKPADYLKVVASLLPKQVEIKETPFDGVSDEQLAALVHAATAALSAAGPGIDGDGEEDEPQSSGGLSPVH